MMGVSTKLKHKIVFDNKDFYWYVGKDPTDKKLAKALHIVSPNKDLLIIYRLDFITDGSVFPKLEVIKSNYIKPGYYDINKDIREETVTPRLVENILLFCLKAYKND